MKIGDKLIGKQNNCFGYELTDKEFKIIEIDENDFYTISPAMGGRKYALYSIINKTDLQYSFYTMGELRDKKIDEILND